MKHLRTCEKCEKLPTFGIEKGIPIWCFEHKEVNSLNVIDAICEDCDTQASFGLEDDRILRWCKQHKSTNSVYLRRKRCEICHQRQVYIIDEDIPKCGTCYIGVERNTSSCAKQWLTHIEETHQIILQTATSCNGEYKIKGTKYKADGYDVKTNTIYEFNGCFWHGCPTCFDSKLVNPITGITYGDLWKKTLKKKQYCIDNGYQFIDIMECKWKNQCK